MTGNRDSLTVYTGFLDEPIEPFDLFLPPYIAPVVPRG